MIFLGGESLRSEENIILVSTTKAYNITNFSTKKLPSPGDALANPTKKQKKLFVIRSG